MCVCVLVWALMCVYVAECFFSFVALLFNSFRWFLYIYEWLMDCFYVSLLLLKLLVGDWRLNVCWWNKHKHKHTASVRHFSEIWYTRCLEEWCVVVYIWWWWWWKRFIIIKLYNNKREKNQIIVFRPSTSSRWVYGFLKSPVNYVRTTDQSR